MEIIVVRKGGINAHLQLKHSVTLNFRFAA